MKTNLDSLFKSDSVSETKGIWFNISETTGFLVKRWGGENTHSIKAALAKYHKPYARLIEMGTMDPEKEKEIHVKVFVHSCLEDWKGVEIDGKETKFEKEIAVKFLLNLPDLADTLIGHATDNKNYREDLGNS